MQLKDKTALVTGANRGIGKSIVEELLAQGIGKVYATARNVKNLPNFGDIRVIPLELDITKSQQIQKVVEAAQDIQLLVNNAGVATSASFWTSDQDDLAYDMNVNYYGTINMIKAFAPVLEKNAEAAIVNIISVAGLAGISMFSGYSASKAALFSATQSIRADLAPKNIHVVGVYPGPIDTDMAKDVPMDKTSPKIVAQNIVAGILENTEYIFPDPMSQQVGETWSKSPKALEKQFAEPFVAHAN